MADSPAKWFSHSLYNVIQPLLPQSQGQPVQSPHAIITLICHVALQHVACCGCRKTVVHGSFKSRDAAVDGDLRSACRRRWVFRDKVSGSTREAFFIRCVWETKGRAVIRLAPHLQTTLYTFLDSVGRHKSIQDRRAATAAHHTIDKGNL